MNLVNELQLSAERDDVLTVLRKTKRLSSKLDRHDISTWLNAELNGYAPGIEIPDYRNVRISFAYRTNGYISAGFNMVMNGIQDLPEIGLDISIPLGNPISMILTWIDGLKSGNSLFESLTPELSHMVRSTYGLSGPAAKQVSIMSRLDGPQVTAIPDRIKDTVLEWALALEKSGVNGDGISFTGEEKRIASTVIFNIHNSHVEQLSNSGVNRKEGT